jgi:hypothetical protein
MITPNTAYSLMSALGQKQTCATQQTMSALPPCVDGSELARTFLNVCNSGHVRCKQECPLWARSGHSNVFDGVRSYCPPMLGSDPTRVTEGGFHLPLRASEWGA